MSKYFVTGGKGFLASHLIPRLQYLGHEVVTDWRYWDDRYDTIIHLAARNNINPEFDQKLIESNFILADKVFRRSERILYASSCAAKYNTNPYAMSKIWSEYLGQKHGNAIGLRFHNLYGIGGSRGIIWFLLNCKNGQKITVRGPELIRDYVAVENAVDEIVLNLNEGVGVKDVGTGIGIMSMDVVNLYMKLSGKSFIIDVSEAGDNEPREMVSDRPLVGAMSLEQGLFKTIIDE